MAPSPEEIACHSFLLQGVFAALDEMSAEERGGRSPRAITDWLFESVPDNLGTSRGLLGESGVAKLEPIITVLGSYQELSRRLWYIGRVHATDRSNDWDTRLLWDFVSAATRDTFETTSAVVALASQGIDAPTKVLLRHAMELYGRILVILRDEEEQRAYLRSLQRLRDFQMTGEDAERAEEERREVWTVGGPLMDRVALIEQNLDETSLPSRDEAARTAALLRDLYSYFSDLTHGGPSMVDDVLYVFDPRFPSQQRRRSWRFGAPTLDSQLSLTYIAMQMWQFWRMVPRALERSGLASHTQGDVGILLVAARALDRAVVQCFGDRIFGGGAAVQGT